MDGGGAYESGVCNIGPAEIARRRRTGIAMSIATVVLLAALLLVHAPPSARLIVFLPAAVAASGFLQAWLRFCAAFGWLGVFNFRDVGTTEAVASADARRRDRAMAIRIGLGCAVVGGTVTAIALLLPA
jgi:hypothetical protein